jgi:hypothetical protein
MMKVWSILYTSRYSEESLQNKTWNSKPMPSEYKHHCNKFFSERIRIYVIGSSRLHIFSFQNAYTVWAGRSAGNVLMRPEPMTFWVSELWVYLYVEEHIYTFIRIPWLSDNCFLQISKYWVSYKTWVEWCVSSLLSLMFEVNGFIFVRTIQRTASRRWRGSNVPAFEVRFFLMCGLFTILSAVKPRVQETNPWMRKAWFVIPLLSTAN